MSHSRQLRWYTKLRIDLWHIFKGGIPESYRKVWTSQDGRQTPICYLDNGHLINILRLLKRRQNELEKQIPVLPPPPRGDMALMAYQEEMREELFNAFVIFNIRPRHPLYQDLYNEATLRGLRW